MTSFFPRKHPCLITVYATHVPSGFLCLDDRKREDIKLFKTKKTQHCRGTVGTSTRAIACALASKPQPLLLLHGHTQHVQKSHVHPARNRSFSSVAVSLIEEVTVEKQRSAPWICGTGTATIRCRAPATFNSFGNPLQTASPFPHSSRNQIVCL